MLVYSWPQINLSGKFNPPLYHPSLFIPAYEHNRMPRSGDSRQPMKEAWVLFFSCPAWKWKTRKQSQHAGCYRCICRAFRIFVLRTHTHWLIEAQECSQTKYWRISPVSVFIFSVCLFFTFLDTNLKPLMRGPSGMVPVHFLDKVWTKCQQFPVHPHSHTLTAKDERPKGQISWQQGDVVLRSIVPLSRIWRYQTLKIRLIQTLVTLIVQ